MLSTASLPSGQHPFEASTASAASHLAPVSSFNNLLDLSSHHRWQKDTSRHHHARKVREHSIRENANREAAIRATAREQADEASHDLARSYLERFLETSEWQDQLDQIGIINEAVPSMEELEGYGDLDEAEGTRACRKMFKAVVVWEQVGHSLWEQLRDDARNGKKVEKPITHDAASSSQLSVQTEDAPRRQSHHRALGSRELHALSIIMEQPNEPQKSRRSSQASVISHFSRGRKASLSSLMGHDRHAAAPTSSSARRPRAVPRRSSSVPTTSRKRFQKLDAECTCCEGEHHDGPRRATDPGPTMRSEWSSDESDTEDTPSKPVVRAATFPRKVSKNCANAVRRTFEALHDPRGKHSAHGARRASTGC